mmetsp:Transcript_5355/g.5517  ORF Transcript_5355/g.5517 Transcript_5355/m.5517 type:complete len:595 (+) Transcript_5355:223-2007(+)|eukprot:CAMPEP_0182418586 /NCGR_PEP_ID=MMETSP1167-20130531/2977_1 /TAXON_ID=2988 /ORGANISM="Mallomonas Sp, Strain CCMP3275" /LENGTH=594 /DNA_ID=CAMNT_0024592857 /DNA_START=119 /DNA_END=1903 /DNA_ORIENTATION=-
MVLKILFICFLVKQSVHGFFNSIRSVRNYAVEKSSTLFMSDDQSLMDQMKKNLGEKEDVFADTENENKQLMQGLRDADRDPNLRVNNKFIEWLGSYGVWVKQESAWGKAPHPIVISSNTEDDGESCGRGLLARESLTEGEIMMTIPLDLCLTRNMAQEVIGKDVIPDYMDEYLAIAMLLMHEKLEGGKSKWKPYIDILPTMKDVYPSYIWTEEELDMLKGSPVYAASKSLRKKLDREYESLVSTVLSRSPTRFPPSSYTLSLFLWAFTMLFSRAARLSSKAAGEELALVPYADLMNHNPYSNTYIDAQRSGLPFLSSTEEVALYADRSYKKFEQVFINYGEKGNADLLLLYGFALDRNPFNSVDVTVGLSKQDPLYNKKMAYLNKSGKGSTSVRFPLQLARYPSELVDFLRLLLVEPEDLGMQPLESVDFNEPISPSLERRVLEALQDVCEGYLSSYPTSVEEDEGLMRDRGMFAALTRQQRMAVKLRASEKRILMKTVEAVKEELVKLPSVGVRGREGEKEKIVAAGRSFDTYESRPTVASATSMKDWVEIRGEKEREREKKMKENASEGNERGSNSGGSIAERRKRRRLGKK